MSKKPIVLCIMDGFGLRSEKHGNAILAANKPNLDTSFFLSSKFQLQNDSRQNQKEE